MAPPDTCVLEYAMDPLSRAKPSTETSASGTRTTNTPLSYNQRIAQLSSSEGGQVMRMFRELFPPSWAIPANSFEDKVCNVRQKVHRACYLREDKTSFVEEVHLFFLYLRPVLFEHMPRGRDTAVDGWPDNRRRLTLSGLAQSMGYGGGSNDDDHPVPFERELRRVSAYMPRRQEPVIEEVRNPDIPPFKIPLKFATRRPVMAECMICWEPLQKDQARAKSKEEHNSSDSAPASNQATSEDNHKHSDSKRTSEHKENSRQIDDLIWCRAKCGVNYHNSCFITWATNKLREKKRDVTCPVCYEVWW